MNSFDQRWQQLVARARAADPASPSPDRNTAEIPHGFATRVVALARARTAGVPLAAEELWLLRTRRAFFAVAAIGIAMVALEFGGPRPRRIPTPGIENTVAQLLWRL